MRRLGVLLRLYGCHSGAFSSFFLMRSGGGHCYSARVCGWVGLSDLALTHGAYDMYAYLHFSTCR